MGELAAFECEVADGYHNENGDEQGGDHGADKLKFHDHVDGDGENDNASEAGSAAGASGCLTACGEGVHARLTEWV